MFKEILKSFTKGKYLLRIDDVAPNMNWKIYFKVKKLFFKYNIKPILGIIPNNKDPELKKFPTCKNNFFKEMQNVKDQGWSIAMHGYEHLYHNNKLKDFLSMRVKSEFVGKNYDEQNLKIKKGIEILKKKKLNTNIFFAPNHSFDSLTLKSLKANNFKYIIDGYGFAPFKSDGLIFIPQMFNRPIKFPFGLHTSVYHFNTFTNSDFLRLEKFVKENYNNIIDFKLALRFKESFYYYFLTFIVKNLLITKRKLQNFFSK